VGVRQPRWTHGEFGRAVSILSRFLQVPPTIYMAISSYKGDSAARDGAVSHL
jgi:hypothetical protein